MGGIAANMLLDMIESSDAGRSVPDVVVAPSLVVRQSTAPAPRADVVAEVRLGAKPE
jgi:DNA-binding LacI/PurR family transcriptional regulator